MHARKYKAKDNALLNCNRGNYPFRVAMLMPHMLFARSGDN